MFKSYREVFLFYDGNFVKSGKYDRNSQVSCDPDLCRHACAWADRLDVNLFLSCAYIDGYQRLPKVALDRYSQLLSFFV